MQRVWKRGLVPPLSEGHLLLGTRFHVRSRGSEEMAFIPISSPPLRASDLFSPVTVSSPTAGVGGEGGLTETKEKICMNDFGQKSKSWITVWYSWNQCVTDWQYPVSRSSRPQGGGGW